MQEYKHECSKSRFSLKKGRLTFITSVRDMNPLNLAQTSFSINLLNVKKTTEIFQSATVDID